MALFKTEIRIQIVGLFFLLGISTIIAKLWWVQIVQNDYYRQKIRGSGEVTVRIPSVRGEIRDKNGLPLVTNRDSYSIDFMLNDMIKGYREALGAKVPRIDYEHTVKGVYAKTTEADVARIVRETVLPRLQQLGINEPVNDKQLQKHFRTDTLVPYTYLEDISFDDMAKLSEHDLGLPGVDLPKRPVREYPFGALASHILGYVGTADTDEEEARQFTYYQPDVEGKNNIEQAMDKWLRGKAGVRKVRKNAKGVIENETGVIPPIPGNNVYLTIDARVQAIAEEAMRVAGRGAAVMVDPNTGDVKAMVSVPSFDPNTFIPSISGDDWSKLIKDETNPLTNRAILSYAPGSTFKTITALAGLTQGKGGNRYTCSGGVTYGGRYMRCWIGQKGGQHGTLDLLDAIKYSCNAYFFQYGNAAGVDSIDRVAESLGIGQKTGVPLSNEAAGILPGKQWLAEHAPREKWSDGHTANLSIGQGYVQCSPLQMAMVAAMLGNGGTCYYPRLIDRVVDNQGQDAVDPETGRLVAVGPRVRSQLSELGLKPEQIEKVRRGMWKVVNDPSGTATHAKLKGTEIAGKTGTAQFWRKGVSDNHTWFICFAPYENPKYAVCVFLQGAKGGGITAAPIAARIIDETMALEAGRYKVDVKHMDPAAGNFTFIKNIDFSSSVPVQTEETAEAAKKKKPAPGEDNADGDEADDHEADASEKNKDRDRVSAAKPKVRESAEPREGSGGEQAGVAPGSDTKFMKSLRNFFRRDPAAENNPESAQDLRAQQKTLRKQQKAQQRQQQSVFRPNQPPPPQPTPEPKRKKFLGIF